MYAYVYIYIHTYIWKSKVKPQDIANVVWALAATEVPPAFRHKCLAEIWSDVVFKAPQIVVSLNSRLESNQEEGGEEARCYRGASSPKARSQSQISLSRSHSKVVAQ